MSQLKQSAVTTKVRMLFDASTRPHPIANSINDYMFTATTTPLQPRLWEIMLRARMSAKCSHHEGSHGVWRECQTLPHD